MYPFRALLDANYETGREAAEAGKPVAWCMRVWNAPLILRVMGIEPVFVENFGTACAAGIAPAYLDRAAAEGFPTYMCGYLVNCLGHTARMKDLGWQIPPGVPQGGMPKPDMLMSSADPHRCLHAGNLLRFSAQPDRFRHERQV